MYQKYNKDIKINYQFIKNNFIYIIFIILNRFLLKIFN